MLTLAIEEDIFYSIHTAATINMESCSPYESFIDLIRIFVVVQCVAMQQCPFWLMSVKWRLAEATAGERPRIWA